MIRWLDLWVLSALSAISLTTILIGVGIPISGVHIVVRSQPQPLWHRGPVFNTHNLSPPKVLNTDPWKFEECLYMQHRCVSDIVEIFWGCKSASCVFDLCLSPNFENFQHDILKRHIPFLICVFDGVVGMFFAWTNIFVLLILYCNTV